MFAHRESTIMTHRYFAAVALLSALLLPSLAGAQGLGYNHVEAGFARAEADNDVTIDGVYVTGSWLIGRNLFLTAGFSDAETDYFPGLPVWAEYETLSAGLGYRVGLAEATDWVTRASYLRGKVTWRIPYFRLDSDSDDGFGLYTGIRHLWTERVEVAAGVSYTDVLGSDETALDASLVYHFNTAIGVMGGLSYSDEAQGFNLGLRVKF